MKTDASTACSTPSNANRTPQISTRGGTNAHPSLGKASASISAGGLLGKAKIQGLGLELPTRGIILNPEVAALTSKMNEMKVEVDDLKEGHTAMKGQMNDLTEGHTEMKGQVSDLTEGHAEMKAEIVEIKVQLADLQVMVQRHGTQLELVFEHKEWAKAQADFNASLDLLRTASTKAKKRAGEDSREYKEYIKPHEILFTHLDLRRVQHLETYRSKAVEGDAAAQKKVANELEKMALAGNCDAAKLNNFDKPSEETQKHFRTVWEDIKRTIEREQMLARVTEKEEDWQVKGLEQAIEEMLKAIDGVLRLF